MAGNGRRNFNLLIRPIEADPIRAERLTSEYIDAVAEHVSYSLDEARERLGISQAELAVNEDRR